MCAMLNSEPFHRVGPVVSVVGDGACDEAVAAVARRLGTLLAQAGCAVVCGGLGGVMRAACEGAAEAGGMTIGILPGLERGEANPFVRVAVATGLGPMRNFLVVANGDAVVAVGGGHGTLSEVALARKIGRFVVAIGRLAEVDGVVPARDADEAARLVREYLQGRER